MITSLEHKKKPVSTTLVQAPVNGIIRISHIHTLELNGSKQFIDSSIPQNELGLLIIK
jgi:hypothetical protein